MCGVISAQEEKEKEEEKKITARDTLPPAEKYGFRVGVDIGRLIRTVLSEDNDDTNDEYTGFEILGDYRIYKNYYLAAEIGNESLLRNEENISVEGAGSYARIGADYNAYNNWYGMQNSIYVGLRYGFSTFNQTLNSYKIFNNSDYFPVPVRNERIEVDSLTASWVEFILGIKVETFKNLYLGANISLRRLLSEKTPDRFDNLFVPGFGRTNDYSSYNVGYTYSISYLIPFVKKKR
ncbi:DUF6048 family protein [Aquimarina addita]|uniref:DUF6048 family protein n=1 Tax=Aquimarina addita TaxID=870485 RepID=A0ABP6US09_9FLAO